jgi:hypothetical protein
VGGAARGTPSLSVASWSNYGILLATRSGMLRVLKRRYSAGQDVFLDIDLMEGHVDGRDVRFLEAGCIDHSIGEVLVLMLLERRPLGTLQNDHDYFDPCPIGCLGSHHQKVERWRTTTALSLDRSYQDSIQTPAS